MAEVIIMPKLGFNMDEGQLVKWCRRPGESVRKGEVLFEINTDKTTMPVEATMDGVLLKVLLQEGEIAAVFTPIAVIGREGENPDAALAAFACASAGESPVAAQIAFAPDVPPPAAAAAADLKLTPKARRLARDEGLDMACLAGIRGSGFQGGITAKDIKASPLARKLAARDGVDLAAVRGTGTGGKIMATDVRPSPAAQSPAAQVPAVPGETASVVPYEGVRKIIGDRLAHSKFTAPHVYFADSVDTTALSAFRGQLHAAGEVKPAVSDLLILAACRALQAFPALNVRLLEDRIVTYRAIHIGLAVAGENGLIVPVVKNVQNKTLGAIAGETRDLVERAKAGRLAPDEYSGGTFTVSNLGPFGIEDFTAIINPPESAIMAVSAVRKKAVVVPDEHGEDVVVARPMMGIRLSVDHRVIDGLLAANFVKYFKELLETPIRILM
jgi:pyruvate dehydrogenase E2 component (dihydrolipoamide acetyltransferase)